MNAPIELDALRKELEHLKALLSDVAKQTRHPDYEWPMDLQREVDEVLRA